MAGHRIRAFTLGDLIDYELQLALDSRATAEELAERDHHVRLKEDVLEAGKTATLKAWLWQVRGPYGERFLQLRQLLNLGLMAIGLLLGWATIRGLLTYDGRHPVNILPFLAVFVVLPLLFLLLLVLRSWVSRLWGRLPGGWANVSGHWLLAHALKKTPADGTAVDVWHRLKALHPRVFGWQAWILSQSFTLAFYFSALLSFLFHVGVNDYAFAWQTTLRMGPEVMLSLVQKLAWPFSWLGSGFVPTADLVRVTQYDRFSGRYVAAEGGAVAADWWLFLVAIIGFYGALPRLLLLIMFSLRMSWHLRSLRFDDLASEELWLQLQRRGLTWEAAAGAREVPVEALPSSLPRNQGGPLLVVRWRQAPFRDEELRAYFESRGHQVGTILDAEGRESELQEILQVMKEGQALALALVCDPWELPGEAFNRLRLAMREKMSVHTPILLAPLQHDSRASTVPVADQERSLWEACLKTFRDPYLGLLA